MESPDNPMRDKTCLVCSDKALGYNFNAVTCESCKAFFRRNALKDKDFKCPFNSKCEINTVTRRFCQFCRLVKCFEVGMKKEFIMTVEEKNLKRKKMRERKTWNGEPAPPDSLETPSKKLRPDDGCSSTVLRPSNILHTSFHSGKDEFLNPGECSQKPNVSPSPSKNYESGSEDGCAKLCEQSPASSYNESLENPRCESPFDTISMSSPAIAEPSSPVGSVLAGLHRGRVMEGNQSRPVEIYQISKAFGTHGRDDGGSRSIIKNILHGEVTPSGAEAGLGSSTPLLSLLIEKGPSTSRESQGSFRTDVADDVLRSIPGRSSRLDLGNSIDSILTEAIKLEYEAYSSINPRINSRELNDAERAKLNELIVANKALLAPLEEDIATEAAQAVTKDTLGVKPMLVDVLNLTAVAIRRLIKMSKKVNAFKNMCQEDQVALLKGGCTEMMILRSAMTYDSDRGSWKIPHSAERLMNIKVDVLKEAGGQVFEEHQRFLQTFDPKWRNDENIMLILSAITLFTPDRPRVVHYDVIKLEQNSYYYLLRRYLESIYPGCEARSTFLKLIHKIAELHRLNEDHVRVYMELNPEDVEPLLIEIFDLNLH